MTTLDEYVGLTFIEGREYRLTQMNKYLDFVLFNVNLAVYTRYDRTLIFTKMNGDIYRLLFHLYENQERRQTK